MHNYGIPTEWVRLALALGIVLSIFVYERWRLTGGAAVVAGYLAIFVNRPLYVLTTLLLAAGTYYLVQHVIARRVFLYGRRRLVVMVLTGMVLQAGTGLVAYLGSKDLAWLTGLYGIGFVLPGLIAQDIERQGTVKTLVTCVATAVLTFLLLQAIIGIKTYLPMHWSSSTFDDETIHYSYHRALLIPAVVLSVVASALLFEWTGIRSGGFLTAAYLAPFVLQPLHLAFILLVGTLVFFFVTRLLMRSTPIFGRTKFATMVLTGLVFTWGLEVLTTRLTNGAFVPMAGFSVISPMIAALVANDGERQGLPKTLAGVFICTLVVFAAIKSVDLLVLG